MLLLNNMANFRVFLCQFWDWVNNDKYFVYLHIFLHLHVFEITWAFIFSILKHVHVLQYFKLRKSNLIYQLIIFYFILKVLQVIQLQVTFKIALQIYNTLNFLFKTFLNVSRGVRLCTCSQNGCNKNILPHNPAGADKSEGAGAGAHGSECLADVPTKPWNPQQASTGTQRAQRSWSLNQHFSLLLGILFLSSAKSHVRNADKH